ncbi:MAG: hypothetical protein ACXVZV_04710 [Terriglobales bacterium]
MISVRHPRLQLDATPPTQKNSLTLRGFDVIGVAGLAMLLCGAWFIFVARYPPPVWIVWMVGPTLWYIGGTITVIWLVWRLSGLKASGRK